VIPVVLAMCRTHIDGQPAAKMQQNANRCWPDLLGYSDLFAHLGFRLASALWSGRATLDGPGLRSLDMVSWDPFLVICLRSSCHSRAIFTGSWDAFVSSALLWPTTLSTVAASAFLGEVWRDPDSVEEVDHTDEAREDEEVEEDTSDIA
jgi:hypothetical protein